MFSVYSRNKGIGLAVAIVSEGTVGNVFVINVYLNVN